MSDEMLFLMEFIFMSRKPTCFESWRLFFVFFFIIFGLFGFILSSGVSDEIPAAAPRASAETLTAAKEISDEILSADTKAVRPKTSSSAAKDETPPRRIALLISVNEYHNGPSPLAFCDKDMQRFSSELKKYDFEVVWLHNNADVEKKVNYSNIKTQMGKLMSKAPGKNDIFVIGYSGHGIQENGKRYLCPPEMPVNPDAGDLILLYESDSQKAPGILNLVQKEFKGTCFLFLDACRSANAAETDITSGKDLPDKGKFHVFSSCKAGEVSYEEQYVGYGRFMYHVNEALADVREGDEITYGKLTSVVIDKMKKHNKEHIARRQTPTKYTTTDEETEILTLGRKNPEVSPPAFGVFSETMVASDEKNAHSASRSVEEKTASPASETQQAFSPVTVWPDLASLKDQELKNIAIDVIQLPGLNGEWWFQEIPWYLPEARLAVAKVLSEKVQPNNPRRYGAEFLGKNAYAYLDTNVAVTRELLWDYLTSAECREFISPETREIMETMKQGTSGNVREMSSSQMKQAQRELLRKSLETLENAEYPKAWRSSKVRTAIFGYTQAVMWHQMVDLIHSENDLERAREAYIKAWKLLKEEANHSTGITARLFYQMCSADYLRFLSDFDENPKEYRRVFEELTNSLKSGYKNSLFQIALFKENALSESEVGRLREASRSFYEVEQRITDSRVNRVGHPLVASFYEQYGWYRIDYWRLPAARENFETALLIRQYNAWSSEDPIDAMYVTYGQHAMGTVARFSGNPREAAFRFKEALKILDKIRNNFSRAGLSLTVNRLNEREASTLERLADITLYGGTGTKAELDAALGYYEQGISEITDEVPTRLRMIAKKAMLLLMQTPDEEKENKKFLLARQCLKQGEDAVKNNLQNYSQNKVVPMLFYAGACAMVDLQEAAETGNQERFIPARNVMRNFLERFLLFSRNADCWRRDTMELRLHCASALLEADLKMAPELAGDDSAYLSTCLYYLSEKENFQAYLRPFYERLLALRLQALHDAPAEKRQEALRALALGIQRMRNVSTVLDMTPPAAEPPVPTTKGAEPAVSAPGSASEESAEDAAEDEEEMPAPVENELPGQVSAEEKEETSGAEQKIMLKPMKNELLDQVTAVIFYFPSDEKGVTEGKGIALIVPTDGGDIQYFPLNLTRRDIRLKYSADTPGLQAELKDIWAGILDEAKKGSSFSGNESLGIIRRSVVVSWSDTSCWMADSSESITKEMFPFQIPEELVTLQ